ncbi:Tol-Pal system-associated acyl-CoA thioesterase [hydrothermal vent metagenome]|uniref:Tol-Pal system-associated acyl-CoA thioesterase n=1 Tax=hydrothermal vent metagenome TaxID=652676 RepID=A0A3B0R589_9ZZZZ
MAELLPHSGYIKDGEHILPLRVYYEDTDAGGIVYYANYLKYMERGRSDMLRELGIDQGEMLKFKAAGDVKFVVVRSEVDYIKPAVLDDEITVHTRLEKAGRASLNMAQEIHRAGDILARGKIRAAVLNENNKPVRLPENIMAKLGVT